MRVSEDCGAASRQQAAWSPGACRQSPRLRFCERTHPLAAGSTTARPGGITGRNESAAGNS